MPRKRKCIRARGENMKRSHYAKAHGTPVSIKSDIVKRLGLKCSRNAYARKKT
jgi:hypothetical protein